MEYNNDVVPFWRILMKIMKAWIAVNVFFALFCLLLATEAFFENWFWIFLLMMAGAILWTFITMLNVNALKVWQKEEQEEREKIN